MPTVKRYATSSDNSGYYVTAYIGGPHPINIKARPLADQLFNELGFGERATITHNLCWAMYEADLLYTDNSLENHDDDTIRGNLSDSLSTLDLSTEQRNRLLSLLDQYSDAAKISKLKSILEDDDALPNRKNTTGKSGQQTASDALDKVTDSFDDSISTDTINDLFNTRHPAEEAADKSDNSDAAIEFDAELPKDAVEASTSIDDDVIYAIHQWDTNLCYFDDESNNTIHVDDTSLGGLPKWVKTRLNNSVLTFARFKLEPALIRVNESVTYKYSEHDRTGYERLLLSITDCRNRETGSRSPLDFIARVEFQTTTDALEEEVNVNFALQSGHLQQHSVTPEVFGVSTNPTPDDLDVESEVASLMEALADVRQFVQSVFASGSLPEVSYDPSSA